MSDSVVREVKGRLRMDTTDLQKASAAAGKFGKDVEQHVGGASKHVEGAQGSFSKLLHEVEGLSPVAGNAAAALEKVGTSGSNIGAALGGVGGIATAAAGAVVVAATAAVEHYTSAAEAVLRYQRVTGAAADEASRMVEVANVLGVSSDTLASAMFRLNMRINAMHTGAKAAQPTLASLGVEIAKNTDGSTNLEATLSNVADAYVRVGGGAQGDAIAMAAFGRSGKELIPILEQGSTGLKALSDNASNVFTQEQLEQVHNYEIAQKQLQASTESLGNSLGQMLVPALARVTDGLQRVIEHSKDPLRTKNDWIDLVAGGIGPVGAAIDHLARSQDTDAVKSREHKEALDKVTQSLKDQLVAAKAIDDENKKAADAIHASIDANFAYQHAERAVADAGQAVADAQQAVNDALARHGPNSKEAKDANDRLNDSLLTQQEDMVKLADAAKTLAEKQSGGALTAAQANQVWVDKMRDLEKVVGRDTPLGRKLEELAAMYGQVSTSAAGAAVQVQALATAAEGHGAGAGGFDAAATPHDAGGPVVPGRVYTVGENRPETLVMTGRGGYVLPGAGESRGPADAGGITANLTIEMPVYLDGEHLQTVVDRRVALLTSRSFG